MKKMRFTVPPSDQNPVDVSCPGAISCDGAVRRPPMIQRVSFSEQASSLAGSVRVLGGYVNVLA